MAESAPALDPSALPRPADPTRADDGLAQWRARAAEETDPPLAAFMTTLAADAGGNALLAGIFGNSPYLSQGLLRAPDVVHAFLTQGADACFENELAVLYREAGAETDMTALMRRLRVGKRRLALTIALADITGRWRLHHVTHALSRTAEATLDLALAQQLTELHRRQELVLPHPEHPLRSCGLTVLGMGKLGAGELNYSSDIDLIVLFDPEAMTYTGRRTLQQCCNRITQNLVKIIGDRTGDGYVFRVDLRLRPDPGSTPPAITLLAAEVYYESQGQNWERAAMIKARPVAGDRVLGNEVLAMLRPFVWRKYLDFNAVRDIHAIKRQINTHRGGGTIATRGHNIKLGRGGIREVEFYAQTQQLIWGGRNPRLRDRTTEGALQALVGAGQIPPRVAADLLRAYRYLRWVEHRLQMTDDQQTQTLPEDGERFTALATFLGYADAAAFEQDLRHHLETVEHHYGPLFAHDTPLADEEGGNLVFTGQEHDPDTLATLTAMGFQEPAAVADVVRQWHHGRYRCTRSPRARELLTELMPTLLRTLAHRTNPDQALRRFDQFLHALPTGVQLFALFQANPALLDLVAEVLGDAPRLADHLARRPAVVEAVLAGGFFEPLPEAEALMNELDSYLLTAEMFEDVLDLTRRWTNERRFQVGVQALRRTILGRQAQAALSDIAEAVLARLYPRVEEEFARRHGRFGAPGTVGMTIVALGKLGSREMTATSDLDLIFIYDVPEALETSDGERPLNPRTYFARLGQRLVNALTARTPEGRLYEVDMRLRPSGAAGPIASSMEAFVRYHETDAWTWEHMALTRARVVCGPPPLNDRVEAAIRETLTRPRDPDALRADVAEMRARLSREKPPESEWDVKMIQGGLVDIEFIAQTLQLHHAHSHPEVLHPNPAEALTRLRQAGLLAAGDADILLQAHRLFAAVQAVLRLTVEGSFDDSSAPPGLLRRLAAACDCPDTGTLKHRMHEDAEAVRALFTRTIGTPPEGEAPPLTAP